MSEPLFGTPVWTVPKDYSSPHRPLDQDEGVDLAIIGGGLFGLSAALSAARRGLSVRVLEAGTVASGASGKNGGQVIPGFKYDPAALAEHFGPERGEILAQFGARTAETVFSLIADEKLNVPHHRLGWIFAAHTQDAMEIARRRHQQWSARGADVQLLDTATIADLTGTKGYLGGWLDRRAGAVDPMALTTELARIAAEAGARIAENVAVSSISGQKGRFELSIADGRKLRAAKVLIATNAYSDTLYRGLGQSLVALHSFQIATEPLSETILKGILPGGQAVSDSRRILVYYRKTPDGRLMLGGRGRMSLPTDASQWGHLEHAMKRLFPQLDGTKIAHRWFGRVGMTPDHMPHVHEPQPGLVAAIGCQGRGVGLMVSLGPKMVDYLIDGNPDSMPLPITPIKPIPLHAFRRIGVGAMIGWYRLLDAFER